MNEKNAEPVPIITFHKVDPSFEWGVTRVTPRQFRKIVSNLADCGYKTVSLDDVFTDSVSMPEKPVVLTFDDGYESILDYAAPVLEEFNFTGTIFIITGFVGKENKWDVNLGGLRFKHLSWAQIDSLKKAGFEIGSHTIHHSDLTRINRKEIENEVFESKQELERKTGDKVKFISFPFGRYNTEVIDLCVKAGYKGGCTYWIHKKDKENPFLMGRRAWYLFDPWFMMQAKLGNGIAGRIEEAKLRAINFFSHGTALLKPAIKD
ncbi:polysaccharide deacetylase family protein [bacterium]|nr:polysaccharide deacetylase family protein [bacterium]